MSSFSIGCQTYSWEMLGDNWLGSPEDILETISNAGYSGVEFSNQMIGKYLEKPKEFEKLLNFKGLQCAAFAYARNGFCDPTEFLIDLEGAQRALSFAAYFGVVLCLGGPSSSSREYVDEKRKTALNFYREVARQAEERGVILAIHPHSHHTSLVVSADEYEWLLTSVYDFGIQFNPDTGHILRGGQDVIDCLERYREQIVHVHIKDVDDQSTWAPLGQGRTPIKLVFEFLERAGFDGWVIIEEESDAAVKDVAKAVGANRRYLREMGY
jgi:inosose dehydratase